MEIHVTAILMQMLNFGIVMGALTYLLLKPVRKILDDRSARIAEGQKAADEAVAEKGKIEELKEKAKKEAREESKDLLAGARKDAEARKAELLEEAKAEASKARDKMLKNIEKEKESLLAEWKGEFEAAVVSVAEQLVGETIDAKKHEKLIAAGLKEIAK